MSKIVQVSIKVDVLIEYVMKKKIVMKFIDTLLIKKIPLEI